MHEVDLEDGEGREGVVDRGVGDSSRGSLKREWEGLSSINEGVLRSRCCWETADASARGRAQQLYGHQSQHAHVYHTRHEREASASMLERVWGEQVM